MFTADDERAMQDLRSRIEASISGLEGWTSPEKGAKLAELVVRTRAAISVEIGVFGGRGSISMALAHQAIGTGRVYAIDPWETADSVEGTHDPEDRDWWSRLDHEGIYRGFLDALLRLDLTRECRVLRERSDSAVRLFEDASVSVLYQDGNHTEEISTREVELWTPKLRSGGYWVSDDVDWATTRRAQALLAEAGLVPTEDHGSWRVHRKP